MRRRLAALLPQLIALGFAAMAGLHHVLTTNTGPWIT